MSVETPVFHPSSPEAVLSLLSAPVRRGRFAATVMAVGAAAGTVVFALQSRPLAATLCVFALSAAILGFRAAQAKLHCARRVVAAPSSVVAAQVGEMHQAIFIRGISYRATLLRLVLDAGTPYEVAMSPEGIGTVVSWLRASSPSFAALSAAPITSRSAPEA